MCKQVFKDGICISQNLGFCKGCEVEFIEELKHAGFKGFIINEDGIKRF